MNKIKVFYAAPTSGLVSEEIISKKNKDLEDILPILCKYYDCNIPDIKIIFNYSEKDIDPFIALSSGFQSFSKLNLIMFSEGWTKSKGCLSEIYVANIYKIPAIDIRLSKKSGRFIFINILNYLDLSVYEL